MVGRSWQSFGGAIFAVGLLFMVLAVMLAKPEEILGCIILFLLGAVFAVIGGRILIWDWKERKTETNGNVDNSLNYVFTLSTSKGTEVITDFAQIENALKELEENMLQKY